MRTPGIVRAAGAGVLALTLTAATVLPARTAWATPPELERARRQIDELQYDLARTSLAAALASGQASTEELVELHRLTGEVAATLGDAAAAQAAFERALALRPSTTLPDGVSPKIAEPFEAARRKLGDHHLIATATLGASSITVAIKDDPAGLVGGARALVISPDGTEQQASVQGRGTLVIAVPALAPGAHARVELLDDAGNVLAEIDADATGGTMAGATDLVGATDTGPSKPLYKSWWLWAGIGGVAAITGTVFGLSAKAAEDDLAALNMQVMQDEFSRDYAEAEALEDKARSRALGANLAFGVAAGCAIAAVVLAFSGSDDATKPGEGTTTALIPTEDGAAFAVGVTF